VIGGPEGRRGPARRIARAVRRAAGRLSVRLLTLHLVVLLVPVAGIELARLVEHQLLDSLERDMRNQAALVRAGLEVLAADDASRTAREILADPRLERVLARAARTTRTRVRVLDAGGAVVADSHREGPPEGPEAPPPVLLPRGTRSAGADATLAGDVWPEVADRTEVRLARAGSPATRTRVRDRDPGVILFLAAPVRLRGQVAGVVYVTRSTQPVLVELYRIRAGLVRVLAVAVLFTGALVLLLAFSVSRPLARLSRAASRIAAGELNVDVPVGGSGEVRELAEAFAAMKVRLDARLRYVSDLAADVAHEFKSPLTSIRGASELLAEGAADDPAARARFLRNIDLDVARLDRLVSRLLVLSRIEASQEPRVPVDLARVAEQAASRAAPGRVGIELDAAAERVVLGREADLVTAVGNLIDNAVHASPPGELVQVRVAARPGRAAAIEIVDRGPGVPVALRSRIFERFFTTDPDRGGTGLGLAIVKAVAEAHGGRVEVASRADGGTTFALELPARPHAEHA
jgi:two-component system sensor histidine kinase ChvG